MTTPHAAMVERAECWTDRDVTNRPEETLDLIRSLLQALEAERGDAERYRQVRTWTPVVFANAWEVNLKTGKPFDEIVDHLKPFRERL